MTAPGGNGHGPAQDFELNLAPIIDCFTVLITFMLVSASFLSIGIFDAGAGIAAPPKAGETPPPVAIELKLESRFSAVIQLKGKSNQTYKIDSLNGDWDLNRVQSQLQEVHHAWPTVDSVVISAADNVEYLQVVRIMETIRGTIPGIVLGGF